MNSIYIPAQSPEDWKRFLAKADLHWKSGYSARSLAYCWQESGGIPPEVSKVLQQVPDLKNLKTIFAFPEHKVALPGGGRDSQNDVWVIAESENGLVSIAVEGKVSEGFDSTVGAWLKNASPGKQERLRFLCEELGLACPPPLETRYQLLHRTVSAVLEARRFRTHLAAMVVHSFSQSNENFSDYQHFVSLFGFRPEINTAFNLLLPSGISLSLAWVKGSEKYLKS